MLYSKLAGRKEKNSQDRIPISIKWKEMLVAELPAHLVKFP